MRPIDQLADHDLVTTAEAAALAHVTPERIRQWARRGHLQPAAWHPRAAFYVAAHVLEVEARMRHAGPWGNRRVGA